MRKSGSQLGSEERRSTGWTAEALVLEEGAWWFVARTKGCGVTFGNAVEGLRHLCEWEPLYLLHQKRAADCNEMRVVSRWL